MPDLGQVTNHCYVIARVDIANSDIAHHKYAINFLGKPIGNRDALDSAFHQADSVAVATRQKRPLPFEFYDRRLHVVPDIMSSTGQNFSVLADFSLELSEEDIAKYFLLLLVFIAVLIFV